MNKLYAFFLGVVAVGVAFGVWWIVLVSGAAALLLKRSYVILFVGILLDLTHAPLGASWYFQGFYTVLFLLIALGAEHIRTRLIWSIDR